MVDPLDKLAELPPWLRYLSVAFCERHIERTELRLIIETQVDPDLRRGDVPGRPGWTFFRTYGRNLMVDGGISSVELDLEDDAEEISVTYAPSLTEPIADPTLVTPAIEALREWFESSNVAFRAAEELADRGVLDRRGTQSLLLVEELREVVESTLEFRDSQVYAELTRRQRPSDDESVRAEWLQWLRAAAVDPAMPLLAEVHRHFDDEDVSDMVRELLDRPLGGATNSAIGAARARELEVPDAPIERLLEKMGPTNHDARAVATVAVANIALDRGLSREFVLDRLVAFTRETETASVPRFHADDEGEDNLLEAIEGMSMGVPMLGEAARLLLEYAPARSGPAVRRALRQDQMPVVMAARLVAIGQPWAIEEVVAAIPEIWNPMFRQMVVETLRDAGFEEATLDAKKVLRENVDPLFETDGPQSLFEAELQSTMMQMGPSAGMFEEWAERVRAALPDDFALD